MKRVIGIVMLLVGAFGVIVGIAGCGFVGGQLDGLETRLSPILTEVSNSMDTTVASLEQTKGTLTEASSALSNAEKTINDAGGAIDDVSGQVSAAVGEDLVNTLGTVETMVSSSVASTVETVEGTLELLRGVTPMLEAQGLTGEAIGAMVGQPDLTLDFLDYAPETSMKSSIDQIGNDIAGIAEQLQETESTLTSNLGTIKGDTTAIAQDVADIKGQVDGYIPLLDQYIGSVGAIKGQLDGINNDLPNILGSVQTAVSVLMLWLILGNLAPLYLGWELVTGKR